MMRTIMVTLAVGASGCTPPPSEIIPESTDAGDTTSQGSTSGSGGATTTTTDATTMSTSTVSTTSGDTTGTDSAREPIVDCEGFDGQVVFVNFDGGTLQFGGTEDARLDTIASSDFAIEYQPYEGPNRNAILERVRDLMAPYNVCVIDERPASGAYSMALVSPTVPDGLSNNVFGLGTPDCGNANPANVGLVFAVFPSDQEVGPLAAVVGFVTGLSVGLEPLEAGQPDVMASAYAGDFENLAYSDACLPLNQQSVSTCGPSHEAFCPPGQQNAHLEMLEVSGPAQ